MNDDDLTGGSTSPIHRIDVARDAYIAEVMHVHLPPPMPPPTPRELPPDVSDFTGREKQLATLDNLHAEAADGSSAVVISAVSGTAGVGKTALAVHWGHRRRDRFSDGLLYIDLRGYDPDRPLRPDEALAVLLRSLGVDDLDIPDELAERAKRYRTLLDDRRMLVVLDNARDVEQVRWLLPGTSSCFVMVTSRDTLAGLVARHGARRLDLDLLPPTDAVALLRKLIGERVDAEPGPAAALAELCVRLPLALRIAAELAASRPAVMLRDLVEELADDRRRLHLLDAGGDPRTAVRAVLSWSYEHLTQGAARAFRLISLSPGRDIDVYATAAVSSTNVDTAHRILGSLARAHLINELGPGRFGMHDLLRAYGRVTASVVDAEADRHDALTKLLDHYLHTAAGAMDLVYPQESHRRPRLLTPGSPQSPVSDENNARAWLDAERLNLMTSSAYAADHGWPDHVDMFGATLYRYLDTGGHYFDALTMYRSAVKSAVARQSGLAEGRARSNLGFFHWRLGRYRDASEQLDLALALHRRVGDRLGEAMTLSHMANLRTQEGRRDEAIANNERAIDIYLELGDRLGEANALANLGIVYQWWGRFAEALENYQRALERHRELDNQVSEAITLGNIGILYDAQGQHHEALRYLADSLRKSRDLGDRAGEARALSNMGVVYRRLGQFDESLRHLTASLRMNQDLGNRTGEALSLGGIGLAYLGLGRYTEAVEHIEQALALHREVGNIPELAETLNELGQALHGARRFADALEAHRAAFALAGELDIREQQARALDGIATVLHAAGEVSEARRHWRDALVIYTELGTSEAGTVRQRLAGLDSGDA